MTAVSLLFIITNSYHELYYIICDLYRTPHYISGNTPADIITLSLSCRSVIYHR